MDYKLLFSAYMVCIALYLQFINVYCRRLHGCDGGTVVRVNPELNSIGLSCTVNPPATSVEMIIDMNVERKAKPKQAVLQKVPPCRFQGQCSTN